MSNLNNVYSVCPGLMSDGRAQNTDYKGHNEVLKKLKEETGAETSYDFKLKLNELNKDIAKNATGVISAMSAKEINGEKDLPEYGKGSGTRDMADNIRFNMCSEIPAGDIKLDPKINLNINKSGSFLDAFGPLSSNTFFGNPIPKVTVLTPELTLPATKLPMYSPYKPSAMSA